MPKFTCSNFKSFKIIFSTDFLFFSVAFVVMVFTALGVFFELCGKYTNCTGCKFIDELDDKLGAWLIYSLGAFHSSSLYFFCNLRSAITCGCFDIRHLCSYRRYA